MNIDQIIVGTRRREDMGDIQALADSISKYGLLHPIVIDDQNHLVAGCRRLAACKLLGWSEIPVTPLGELSDRQLREIELEENLRRKDLTEIEKSRNMVELAELKVKAKTQVKDENLEQDIKIDGDTEKFEVFRPSTGRNTVGRPSQPDSIRETAKEIGVSPQTLHDAHAHVEAVNEYPELSSFPKTHAIEIARQLKAMPEPVRQEKRKEIQQIEETGKHKLDLIDETHKIKKEYSNAIYGAATLAVDDDHLDAWLSNMLPADMQRQWELVEEGLQKLEALQSHLKKIFGGPRLVKLGGNNQ